MSADIIAMPPARPLPVPAALSPAGRRYARLLSGLPAGFERTQFERIADNLFPGWRGALPRPPCRVVQFPGTLQGDADALRVERGAVAG